MKTVAMDTRARMGLVLGAVMLLTATAPVHSSCPAKGSITCPAGQTAIDENDLEIEHRPDSGPDVILNPTDTVSVTTDDTIFVKYRPGGVTAIMEDIQCFEADFKRSFKVSFKFTNDAGDEEEKIFYPWSTSWNNNEGVGNSNKWDGFDDIRVRVKSGTNPKIRNFDFVGCA